VDLDAADPQALLGSLTKQEASALIDALQQVRPAERVTAGAGDPPPGDLWTAEPAADQP
jgi:hypothetical protein